MALKAVGNAIKNSPRAIRKKFKGDNHEVLDEDWYHSEDPVKTGVVFYCKVNQTIYFLFVLHLK
jgi:hypothetical protein